MASNGALYTEFKEATRQPNYFNGRLLTATDLRAEQEATRTRDRRLGRALGSGIVEGFAVQSTGAIGVTVDKGLAINGLGQALELGVRVSFDLGSLGEQANNHSSFRNCSAREPQEQLAAGAYLLVASPATDYQDRVETIGIESGSTSCCGTSAPTSSARSCGHRWEVEGVAFELLALPANATGVESGHPRFANVLAHWCLGDFKLPADFREYEDGLDLVPGLKKTQVPLALVYLSDGVRWVSNWAAKRPVDSGSAHKWSTFGGQEARGRGIARFFEFQEEIERVLKNAGTATVKAKDHFRFLPPAGLLPLKEAKLFAPGSDSYTVLESIARGVILPDFFDGIDITTHTIATREEVRMALEQSWRADATDLEIPGKLEVYLLNADVSEAELDLENSLGDAIKDSFNNLQDKLDAITTPSANLVRDQLNRLEAGESIANADAITLVTSLGTLLGQNDPDVLRVQEGIALILYAAVFGGARRHLYALFLRRPRDLFAQPVDSTSSSTSYSTGDYSFRGSMDTSNMGALLNFVLRI